MPDISQCANLMGDKEILEDSLISQKHITEAYNTWAGECASPRLRGAMLNILDDEHIIQADLFSDLQSHGWYQTETAEAQKLQQARQRYPVNA